jgi:hypothetical protein
MSHQAMKRHGGSLTLLNEWSQCEKAKHTLWLQLHNILEKAKLWTVKRSVTAGGEQAEHKGFLWQWNYSVWYILHDKLIQTERTYDTKVNPNLNNRS